MKNEAGESLVPDDLHRFLSVRGNRRLTLEPGAELQFVELLAPNELCVSTFTFSEPGSSRLWELNGVDLVKSCEHYSPRGVFIWLPQIEVYGAWDGDHKKAIIFPGVTWTTILRNPHPYLNGQWYPERVKHRSLRARDLKPKDRVCENDESQPLLPGF